MAKVQPKPIHMSMHAQLVLALAFGVLVGMIGLEWHAISHGQLFNAQDWGIGIGAALAGLAAYVWGHGKSQQATQPPNR
jgi:hypothetical protein